MRTAIKAFEANPSEELFRAASSAIDKAETKRFDSQKQSKPR